MTSVFSITIFRKHFDSIELSTVKVLKQFEYIGMYFGQMEGSGGIDFLLLDLILVSCFN